MTANLDAGAGTYICFGTSAALCVDLTDTMRCPSYAQTLFLFQHCVFASRRNLPEGKVVTLKLTDCILKNHGHDLETFSHLDFVFFRGLGIVPVRHTAATARVEQYDCDERWTWCYKRN